MKIMRTVTLPKTREECWREGWKAGMEAGFLQLSKRLEEHPEKWDGPCWCADCQNYAEKGD